MTRNDFALLAAAIKARRKTTLSVIVDQLARDVADLLMVTNGTKFHRDWFLDACEVPEGARN